MTHLRNIFAYVAIVLLSMLAAVVLRSCDDGERPAAPSYLPDNKH